MATNKRMFSNDIVGSDAFLEMPSTTQALYFHLGMRCDDDGFVNPNVTMRMTGANKNDLDVLISKRFLLLFKNGVVVIKHHRINNNWDSRDCRRTLYTEELKQLFIKENNSYTLDDEQGTSVEQKYLTNKGNISKKTLPDGDTTGSRRQNRIEENRIEENIDSEPSSQPVSIPLWNYQNKITEMLRSKKNIDRVLAYFWLKKGFIFENSKQLSTRYSRDCKIAKKLIESGYNVNQIEKTFDYVEKKYKEVDWTLETIIKSLAEANK